MQKLISLLFIYALLLPLARGQDESSTTQGKQAIQTQVTQTKMSQARMIEIIKDLVGETEGTDGNMGFVYDGIAIALVSDIKADRMRLVAAVIDAEQLTEEQILATLVSNYHLALDARYAIGGGVLYSTYIHPLSALTKEQLLSGVRQVASLSKTFGSSYTSGEMSFGLQVQEERLEI